jgi:hypothetical protein
VSTESQQEVNVKCYVCLNATRKEGEKMCTATTSRSINAERDLFIFFFKFFFVDINNGGGGLRAI